jgi:hypothetical protein
MTPTTRATWPWAAKQSIPPAFSTSAATRSWLVFHYSIFGGNI